MDFRQIIEKLENLSYNMTRDNYSISNFKMKSIFKDLSTTEFFKKITFEDYIKLSHSLKFFICQIFETKNIFVALDLYDFFHDYFQLGLSFKIKFNNDIYMNICNFSSILIKNSISYNLFLKHSELLENFKRKSKSLSNAFILGLITNSLCEFYLEFQNYEKGKKTINNTFLIYKKV